MPVKAHADFVIVFNALRNILQPYSAGSLRASTGAPGNYALIGTPTEASDGKEVWFGGAQIKKNYVSYHLMAVYVYPELLKNISPALKKRMQGKSCFNFKDIDETLFKELAKLTEAGYKRYKKEKLIE